MVPFWCIIKVGKFWGVCFGEVVVLKLNEGMVERVRGLVSFGLPPVEAAAAAGVSKSSFYSWWKRGEGDAQSADSKRTGSIYAEFYRTVWAEKVGLDVKVLNQFVNEHLLGEKTDWRAFSWWLSKRLPEHFGDKVGKETDMDELVEQVELLKSLRDGEGLVSGFGANDKPDGQDVEG